MSEVKRRIIVSMTSWPKRINNVAPVVYSILKQTVKPDSIELNLSEEEFPNHNYDLPEDLQILIENKLINVNYVPRNIGVFKKIIPTLMKYYGEDYYLLSIDDDWIYNKNYIDTMIKEIGDGDSYCLIHELFHGYCMIYRSRIFKDNFWKSVTEKMIAYNISDQYMYLYIKKYGGKMVHGHDYKKFDYLTIFNPVFPNSKNKNPKSDAYDTRRVLAAYAEINKVIKNME